MAEVTPHACRAIFAILMKFALPVELLKYHEMGPFVRRNRYSTAFFRHVAVPCTQYVYSHIRRVQLYRDPSAGEVPVAQVASGGKVGPVSIYRHPLLLR